MTALRSAMIMAGGTGGHVFPGLAIAQALLDAGWDVAWIGTERGLEARVVPANGITLHALKTLGLRGKGIASKLRGLLSLLYACVQAFWLLLTKRPSVVVGFGGYAAGPAGMVAWLLGIPVVIHEQNAVSGTTNRLLSRVTKRLLAGFEGAFGESADVRVTGNPVRETLRNLPAKDYPDLCFSEKRPLRVVILGGSQGALALNEGVPSAFSNLLDDTLSKLAIRHQCGPNHLEVTRSAWAEMPVASLEVIPFIDDMAALYRWADVAICRAGALTVCELSVTGTPAVLVPLPNAIDNHQLKNAEVLRAADGALIVEQADLSSFALRDVFTDLVSHSSRLNEMSLAARAWSKPDATEAVVAAIEEVVDGA